MFKPINLEKSLPITFPMTLWPQPRAYSLTTVHNVRAQPQKNPRVSLSASQQAAEEQAQAPQHASTCVEGPELLQGDYSP